MDICKKIHKYDSQLEYISGYVNCKSKVKCKCNRCGNVFERAYTTITRKNTECSCPHCQWKIARTKQLGTFKNIRPYNQLYENRLIHFINTIKKLHPKIIYISGFEDNKSKVLVECKLCGYRFERTVDRLMRKNRTVHCDNCDRLRNNLIKKQQRHIKLVNIERKKEIVKLFKDLNKHLVHIIKCKYCGNDIYTKSLNAKVCDRCRVRYDKKHSNKSLKELYKRDNGICYICNKKCNYEDYTYRGNTFIAGNYYPSIDHVIPLCKGGTDEWDNLRLAHRICNSYKSLKDTA